MRLTRRHVIASSALMLLAPRLVSAATGAHTVEMLNKHPEDKRQRNCFLPRLLVVEPGDTVSFVSTDPGHNTASLPDMLPAGADGWESAIGKDVDVTFTVPGFYGHVCTPHASAGMVGLIVVKGDGMMDNLDAAQAVKHRAKAKKIFADIWEEAAAQGLTS